jgi:hypothetical protein
MGTANKNTMKDFNLENKRKLLNINEILNSGTISIKLFLAVAKFPGFIFGACKHRQGVTLLDTF